MDADWYCLLSKEVVTVIFLTNSERNLTRNIKIDIYLYNQSSYDIIMHCKQFTIYSKAFPANKLYTFGVALTVCLRNSVEIMLRLRRNYVERLLG